METQLQARVRERLASLKINPFEAARHGGLERGFINDILNGKKKSIRGDNLWKVAAALHCTTEYLLGESERPFPGIPPGWVMIIGFVDSENGGVINFDEHNEGPELHFVPSILGLPSETMFALEVRGSGLDGYADDGSLIYYNSYFETVGDEWIGEMCVVEVEGFELLIGRLLPGSSPGRYHIARFGRGILMDQEVHFAGGICAVISPWQTAQLERRHETPGASSK
jgi:DNA-binding Xre family transcriptional regulator